MKIIAVGMNYAAHNREMSNPQPDAEPVIFLKPDSALLTGGRPFFIPDFTQEFHYETEIVLRICRLGKHIDERFAHRYYDALTVGIDFTARDLQKKYRAAGLPWDLSKGFDGSAVVGKFISVEEVGDVQNIDFHLDIDGNTVQKGNTSDMLFGFDKIISFVSRYFTLKTGDLIYTGTPAGVGTVKIGNNLKGFVGDRKLLDFNIK